jgi:uncharacterized protein (TIGR02118 family)
MLARRRDRSVAAFRAHWLGKHADIVRGMPQLQGYLQNHLTATIGPTVGDIAFDVDGIPELWFVDEAAKSAAFESLAAKQLPVDEKNFIDGITIFSVEETVPLPGDGGAKVLVLRRGAAADADAIVEWCRRLAAALPGIRACVCNRVLTADGRPAVTREKDPPDAIVALRFATTTDAEAAFSSAAFVAFAADAGKRGEAFVSYLVEEHVIVQ